MFMSHQSKEQVRVVRGKRYKVMKLLGKGGSSRVAFDEEKNIVVAIKRVSRVHLSQDDFFLYFYFLELRNTLKILRRKKGLV